MLMLRTLVIILSVLSIVSFSQAADEFPSYQKAQAYSQVYNWYANNHCESQFLDQNTKFNLDEQLTHTGTSCVSVYDRVTAHKDNDLWAQSTDTLKFKSRYRVKYLDGREFTYKQTHEFVFDSMFNIGSISSDKFVIDRRANSPENYTDINEHWKIMGVIYNWTAWLANAELDVDEVSNLFSDESMSVFLEGNSFTKTQEILNWFYARNYTHQNFILDRANISKSDTVYTVYFEYQWSGVNAQGEIETANIEQVWVFNAEPLALKIRSIKESYLMPIFDMGTQIEC